MNPLPSDLQAGLDRALAALRDALGDNLHSCALYGSAVRGGLIRGVSDLNLLIILKESTPEAHTAVAEAIRGDVRIEPFILGLTLLERSFQAFAVKFLSIRRNYRVLHGPDPLAALRIDEALACFLCEQAVRNLHLRLTRAFVVLGHEPRRYGQVVLKSVSAIFTHLSEALRRKGIEVPAAYEERILLIERTFDAEASVLKDLLERKKSRDAFSPQDVKKVHDGLFRLLDRAVRWMEAQWPPLKTSSNS